MKHVWWAAAAAALLMNAGCDNGPGETKQVQLTPTSPSSGSGGSAALMAPTPDSPAENAQLATLRPTLTVRNATSSQAGGARLYEFQISDNTGFTASGGVLSVYYAVIVNKTGVAEDPSGKTSFTVDTDLQDTLGLVSASFGNWEGVPGGQHVELTEPDERTGGRHLSLQFSGDHLVGCNAIGWTQHVGVMRGLVEGQVPLGASKNRLLQDPTLLMEASLDAAQSHAHHAHLK